MENFVIGLLVFVACEVLRWFCLFHHHHTNGQWADGDILSGKDGHMSPSYIWILIARFVSGPHPGLLPGWGDLEEYGFDCA